MTVQLTTLNAISPVDGRYRRLSEKLAPYFSEGALIKYRLLVEVEYFIALCRLPLPQLNPVPSNIFGPLRKIYAEFNEQDALRIKAIEKTTNHDVKAVEYFLKEKFDSLGLSAFKEFIHFGLTSQDINNTAQPYALKAAWTEVLKPLLQAVIDALSEKAQSWKTIPMLARTHGQPASPTTVGKEIYVFVDRLKRQLNLLEKVPFSAKFGGATGNFNAHFAAYPDQDWFEFADRWIGAELGLERMPVTTQIEPYDNQAAFCDGVKRINTICIDLCRDIWSYIALDYFRQKIHAEEVGSSAMPHKVNPIDFENAEGNLGIANALLQHLAAKLPVSRLQRDLTDSTVTRNLGVPLAHSLIALTSILRGLDRLLLNDAVVRSDLQNNWVVVAEAIQTILRREGYPEPFEALKALTRKHAKINQTTIVEFIRSLDVAETVKEELLQITPENYTGRYRF